MDSLLPFYQFFLFYSASLSFMHIKVQNNPKNAIRIIIVFTETMNADWFKTQSILWKFPKIFVNKRYVWSALAILKALINAKKTRMHFDWIRGAYTRAIKIHRHNDQKSKDKKGGKTNKRKMYTVEMHRTKIPIFCWEIHSRKFWFQWKPSHNNHSNIH